MKNQRGEIATVLTLITIGVMFVGIVVGKLAVQQPVQTQSKAVIRDPENPEFNPPPKVPKDENGDFFPDSEEIRKPPKDDQPILNAPKQCEDGSYSDKYPDGECPDLSKSIPPNTPVPPPPATSTPPPRLTPLPDHSIKDCGGPPNQCNPATDDPKICGNDGCLHAAVGRPTPAPTLAPPAGVFPTLPGRDPRACGGSWYQCNPGELGCGNDGCSNIRLGRPFEQPVPLPPNITITPIPGRSADQCHGRYYQCVKGTPDCATDGCNDKLLQRGKYAVTPILTSKPGTPTVIQPIATPSKAPTPTFEPADSFCKEKKAGYYYNSSNDCLICWGEEREGEYGAYKWGQYSVSEHCRGLITPSPKSSLPNPINTTAADWNTVVNLASTGKVSALSVSNWVQEAAKYYYPGIQIRFCDPGKGECDFKL